jgi:hypothetical protein
MLYKNRSSFVCFDCRSDVYYSVRAVPHTLLCDQCLWIRTLMPNPAERAEMRADEVLKGCFESYGAGSRLRFGWARRWSMRRIMARVTIASATSGRCS